MKDLLVIFIFLSLFACAKKEHNTWEVTGGSKENLRYSTINQINTSNVQRLKVAWVYHTKDADTLNNSQIQCNPIIVDGILYATSPQQKLFALDASTGQEKWIFDPKNPDNGMSDKTRFILNNNRGVTYWKDEKEQRIFYVASSSLFCINALTGKLDEGFGHLGQIDLHEGLGKDVGDLYVTATSPGIIYKDLLILGSRVSEGSDAAPGHIRAYDVRTGEQAWIFHTIPRPGEIGYETWEDSTAYRHIGGANSWAGFSLDEERGLLFAPTGSASFDFYGGKRKGDNLFANCILALDAATGNYKWHFQTVHHDIWDKDIPTAPSLITIKINGNKEVDVVAQPTKYGNIFLLDRETGKPIYPIEEIPVPFDTDLAGEQLSKTQPVPSFPKPFARQDFLEEDLNHLVPDSSYEDLKKRYLSSRHGNMYNPISLQGTIVFPGLDGGAEWGGPAFDPESQLFYVNANEVPWLIQAREVDMETKGTENYLKAGKRLYNQYCISCHGPDRKGSGNNPSILKSNEKLSQDAFTELIHTGRRMMPAFNMISKEESIALASFILDLKSIQQKEFEAEPIEVNSFLNLPYNITGYNRFQTKEGLPGISPPWGTLNAVNMVTGEIEWRIPLGEIDAFKEKGIKTGSENYGGPVVTAGGLLFIAATPDRKFRAYNKANGKLLWEYELPAAGFATPSIYEVNGRQFIVIACGGGKLGAKSGDSYMAFALE
ncbi:outer membrane protein assembly factor BamB family protein [Echinicola shivajiensis]|uniref:outer membrane protein assembly factor BamB family protein n=1 Tax=Echinicola shivajiensis TaxID=1035916 RepID=UPI001BFCAFBA|nr:PQQ-binding-like beta-propeller repeat protein [Echinicola shivajiensis]